MSSGESEINNIQKLKDADAYTMWDFEVKVLFKAKGLMDIVNGTETLEQQGEDTDKVKTWKLKDAKAQHIILMTIEHPVKSHLVTCETSKEMFETLSNIYKRDTSQQKCSLLQEFYNYKFDNQKDMMSNLAYIQNVAYKLNRLDQKVDDTMIITKILSILPEYYKHFSSAWDSTNSTDRTLENLKARLIQEEAKSSSDSESVAFKIKSQGMLREVRCYSCKDTGHIRQNCPNNKSKFCNYCKKSNHYEKDCFLKNKSFKPKVSCSICKKTNHTDKDCYFRNKSKAKPNRPNDSKTAFLTKTVETHSPVGYSSVNQNSIIPSKTFIVDSGCTPNHMTNDLSILENVKSCNKDISVAKKNQSMQSLAVGYVDSEQCI